MKPRLTFRRTVVLAALIAALFSTPKLVFAACNPPANEGDVAYSSASHTLQYCNGTSWILMGSNSPISFGTLTSPDFCTATGSTGIQCTTAPTGTGNVVLATSPTITTPTLSGTVSGGTFSGGAWNGTVIGATYGGTGINNGSNTITLGGNVSTAGSLTTVGAYGITLTAGATTSLALPASGTVVATATVSPAQGDILYYNGSAWTDLVHGTSGQYLQTQGASANPQWATVTVGTGSLTGVVQVANGGTGDTTLAAGSLLLGNGTGAVATLADVATGSVLISGGSGSNPSYSSSPTISGANITSLNGSNIASGTVSASYLPSFGSAAAGIVPASGGGTTNFLRADGSWAVASTASGTVTASPQYQIPYYSASGTATTLTGNSAIVTDSSNDLLVTSGKIGLGTAVPQGLMTVYGASTLASATGATLDYVSLPAATTTLTGTTGITNAKGLNAVSLYQPTYTDSSSVTVTNAATLYIDNAPAQSGSVTITNPWALWVGAGNVKFPGTGNSLGTITSGTWNGTVITGTYGGTGVNNGANTITVGGNFSTAGAASLPVIAQGDIWYGSAAGTISALAKNTTATRYLANTGTSNNPAWAQVNLANGVTGNLPNANLATQTANTVLGALTATTPSGLTMPSCSTGTSALTWTTGTGFGCNSIASGSGTVTASPQYQIPYYSASGTATTLTGNSAIVTDASNDLLVTSGTVAIGTNAPQSTLSVYNGNQATTLTNFTQGIGSAGINVMSGYTAGAYTPGVFWSTNNNNPTKPKAGIWTQDSASGSYLNFGTSNAYATGITNQALVIDYSGHVGIGTTAPDQALSFGSANQTIDVVRSTTGAGSNLTIQAGGAQSGGTDLAGGNINFYSGTATGAGTGSTINFYVNNWAGSGTADNVVNNNILSIDWKGLHVGNSNGGGLIILGSEVIDTPWPTAGGTTFTIKNDNGGGQTNLNDVLGTFKFTGTDNAWSDFNAAAIKSTATNVTSGATAGNLTFQTMNAGTLSDRMTILSGGNVGIGTTVPSTQLHLYTSGGTTLTLDNATSQASVAVNSGGSLIFNTAGHSYSFQESGSPKVVIDTSGNVGIGTTALANKLDVNGAASIGYVNTAAPSNGLIVSGNVGIGTTGPGTPLEVSYSNAATSVSNITGVSIQNTNTTSGAINGLTLNNPGNYASAAIYTTQTQTGNAGDNMILATKVTGGTTWNSNQLVLNTNGNVGIGTTGPGTPLQVDGSTTAGGAGWTAFFTESSSAAGVALGSRGSSTATAVGTIQGVNSTVTATTNLLINPFGGNVGIGNTGPSYVLDVTGEARFTGGYTTSDRRWKTDIEPIKDALDTVAKLQGVTFDWRRKEFPAMRFAAGKQIGFIAQDVEKVLPQIVSTDNKGYKNISYESVIPVLAEAVKELKAENDNHAADIDAIRADEAAQIKVLRVDYGRLTPLAIKAIQEQQAQIEELRALVTKQGQEFEAYRKAHP